MKKTLFYVFLALCTFGFVACEKDSDSQPVSNITGLYVGTYSVEAGADEGDSLYYSFFLRPDSVLQVQGLGADGATYYGIGKWNLSGSVFNGTINTSNLSQAGVNQVISGQLTGSRITGNVQTVNGPFRARFSLFKSE